MANVTRSSSASVDASTAMFAPQVADLIAGEDLTALAPCRIHSDGLVYESNGTALNASARFSGVTAREVKAGEPVTLFGLGTRFHLADSGLTPGAYLYVSATKGEWDDAATTGDPNGTLEVISATDVRVIRQR